MRSRVCDWSPVGFDSDPTPGDVDVVAALIGDLRKRGDWFLKLWRLTSTVGETLQDPTWSGLAGQAFRERLAAAQADTESASIRNGQAADACQVWGQAMFEHQFEADRALQEAEAAQVEIEAAEASILSLTATYDQALAVAAGMAKTVERHASAPPPSGTTVPSSAELAAARRHADAVELERSQATRSLHEAQQRLEDARAAARTAHDEFDHAERVFADAIVAAKSPSLDTSSRPLQDFCSALGTLATIEKSGSGTDVILTSLLSRLTFDQLKALLTGDPALAQQFWDNPPDPEVTSGWWHGLSAEKRAAYIETAPGIIGNLPGIPFRDRRAANWISYQEAIKNPNLTTDERKVIDAMEKALKPPVDGIPVQIVSFNFFSVPPMLAIGYGDLDTCDPTTWNAGGMGFGAQDALKDWSDAAKNLWMAQRKAGARKPGVVACFEYDNPDTASVNVSDSAKKGAARFAAELDGNAVVRSAFGSTPSRVSVTAHSYGTTMASMALTRVTFRIDSFVMVGSAGLDTTVVPSLDKIRADHLYTTAATADRLAPFGATLAGRANPNPSVTPPLGQSIGGAQAFPSDGDGKDLERVDGHNPIGKDKATSPGGFMDTEPSAGHGYYDSKTQSLKNIAAVTVGDLKDVSGGLMGTMTLSEDHNRVRDLIDETRWQPGVR